MAERLKVYVPRAPRYTLLANENKMLRFQNPKQKPQAFGTEILNVSNSGLAFLYRGDFPPQIGELITIQFQVPGREKMACYAEVIRQDDSLFGVRFYNMGPIQRMNLKWGLNKSFQLQKEKRAYNHFLQLIYAVYDYRGLLGKALMSLLSLIASFWLINQSWSPVLLAFMTSTFQ